MGNTNKQYKVIISEKSAEMLVKHIRFMAQVSLQAADKLRVDIIEAAKSLENFPQRNAWLRDPVLPANKYRKMIVAKRYLLIYQIKDCVVYIEHILDCRQDYKWLL